MTATSPSSVPRWDGCSGWSAEELTSVPLCEFLHPDDQADMVESTDRELIHGPGSRYDCDVRMLCRDGTYRWARCNERAVRDEELLYEVGVEISPRTAAEGNAPRLPRRTRTWPPTLWCGRRSCTPCLICLPTPHLPTPTSCSGPIPMTGPWSTSITGGLDTSEAYSLSGLPGRSPRRNHPPASHRRTNNRDQGAASPAHARHRTRCHRPAGDTGCRRGTPPTPTFLAS
jgi:PAS domain S-box-containing protein